MTRNTETTAHAHPGWTGIGLCLAAALLFGATTPLSKNLLGALGPLSMAGLLYLGAAAVTSRSAPGAVRAWRVSGGEDRWRLAGALLFGGVIGPVLLLMGLRLAAAGTVSLWLNLETVATTALAWALFREHVGWREWLACALVAATGALLAGAGGWAAGPAALWVGLACLCWGLDNNLTALIGALTPAQTTFLKGAFAGTLNLTLGLGLEGAPETWSAVQLALLAGAFGYGWSISLYIAGARQIGAARSQMWFASAPFAGLALSWLALGEPIVPEQIAAGLVMAVGLGLLLTARHAHLHRHEPLTHTHSHRHDDGHHEHAHPGVPPERRHTHPHTHEPARHSHPHEPDLHHRHAHGSQE